MTAGLPNERSKHAAFLFTKQANRDLPLKAVVSSGPGPGRPQKNRWQANGYRRKAMRYTVRLTVIFSLVTVLLFTAFPAAGKQDQPRRPGALLYKIREGAAHHELRALNGVLNALGASNRKVLRGIGVNLDEYPQGLMSEEAACEKLMATGAVAFAEPDYLVTPDSIPNDTYYAYQWQHDAIRTPEAWDTTTGDPSVIVAVCDTGISSGHPDLADNLILPGYNVDGSTNTEPVYEQGTGVAGCLGAVGNNGLGVTGVAWRVGILPIRITNTNDGEASLGDAAEGIMYAADYGARVVNLSYRMALYSTIDAAAQYLRDRGGLLFVSAGNLGGERKYWPVFDSFISVGATTYLGEKWDGSDYGPYVDLVAPGEGVYSTTGADGYGYMSGTSFASPIAAGVAALVFAFDPDFTPDQVEGFLFAACSDLDDPEDETDDTYFGHGLVDAAETLYLAGAVGVNDAPVVIISVTPSEGIAPLAVTADGSGSYDSDGSVVSWSWDLGDGNSAEGSSVTHVYQAAGTYTIILTVQDDDGATATDAVTITVLTSGGEDPVIFVATLSLEPVQASNGEIGRAAVTVVDGQGQPVPGVLVWGQWSGIAKNKERGITDAAGQVVFDSHKINKSGTLTFTVTDLSCYGYVYDPALNRQTSVSLEWP